MTYRLRVGAQAGEDIRLAAQWYEDNRPGMGRLFVLQIDQSLDRVRSNPENHQILYRDVRRSVVRRFPYGVFFRIEANDIVVLAVVDLRRDPSTWQSRTG